MTDQDLPDDDMDDSIYDIPVTVKAVLGKTTMLVSQLLKLGRGAVVALDRRLDEPVDVYANDRLIARGEVIVSDEVRIGVSLTEILASTRLTLGSDIGPAPPVRRRARHPGAVRSATITPATSIGAA